MQDSVAATAIGDAEVVAPEAGARLLELYRARHPNLAVFAASPSCAIVQLRISSYPLVSRFREVVEWRIGA